ncbi:protein-L-isoaspartate O-methyltransferase [Uruburuella testudinis]|uniref:Protein-L-isoaspartate O-methyltransferase n=1 Tax=Uruburuella testudinis TaxID=1282863 RepID=A0ABY4DRE2_9NEIS|nr:protein-L-isoaspartate O-methyltransferase [Uruburuella testudinis]UOO81618.1 protein-L-isoaspartate O-methyltransferase [Uruburuella testudinis]
MNFEKARFNMVEQQIRPWDVLDFGILDALGDIPREAFVSDAQKPYAYSDKTLPLPNGGSMLEPKIVARMIQGLDLQPADNVLEIGTGSGYAAALLCKMAANVTTIDIDTAQQQRAQAVLDSLGYRNITYQTGDGLAGEAVGAPFDAIYIGGGVNNVPENLLQQLKNGGRMVVVVGDAPVQRALRFVRNGDTFVETTLFDTLIPKLSSKTDAPTAKFSF